MDAGMPYFMTNPDWYTVIDISEDFPEDGRGYHLTDSAPEEAVKSYEEFYSLVESEGFPLNNDKQGKWWNESSVTGKFDYQLDRHCSKTEGHEEPWVFEFDYQLDRHCSKTIWSGTFTTPSLITS